ncbi:hypothetical protein ACP4OV_000981 [Aristida adscensionis]
MTGAMSKRRGPDSQSQGKRPRTSSKKHLYLVLDDWDNGYSIHKIDLACCHSDSGGDNACTDHRLPEPPALRLKEPFRAHFVAVGSNIVVVNSPRRSSEAPSTLIYDTAAATLAIGAHVPGRLAGPAVAVAARDAVYALTTLGGGLPLSLEALSWAPCTGHAEAPGLPPHEWSWKSVPAPPPPFGEEKAVASYAVHPDGHTVFLSVHDGDEPRHGEATYSFDAGRGEWRCHGEWALPFQGQGHFDAELDAWVGLHKEEGYVCTCQVVSRRGKAAAPPDSDKVGEKLFCKGDKEEHLGATLTYMGDSKFCLVESVVREDAEMGNAHDGFVIHVTIFGLEFNRKGKLQTTNHHTTTSYVVSKSVQSFSPLAFWI